MSDTSTDRVLTHSINRRTAIVSAAATLGAVAFGSRVKAGQAATPFGVFDASKNAKPEKVPPYQARFGRTKPLVAIVGLNEGTVISDFCIPFGVMARSGVADVMSVSVKPGPVKMQPLTFQLQATVDEFDKQHPDGADYVFVPAVENDNDPELLGWIKSQAAKGCTVISICYGALAVANTGLFDGHRATSHYSNEGFRAKRFPKVKWQKNIRYVADGKVASSAGVSASMPTSIALVEAIAGHAKAAEVARDVGIENWNSRHDSDAFQSEPGNEDMPARDARPDVALGIPVKAGDDEIALALTAEAYSRTGNTFGYAVAESKALVRLAHGLVVLPDMVAGTAKVSRMLAPLEAHQAMHALDIALTDITKTYGPKAARNVALFMEHPGKIE